MSGRCCDIANGSWMGATEGPAVDLGLGHGLAAAVGGFAWHPRSPLRGVASRLRNSPVMISFRGMRYRQVSAPKLFSHGSGWGTVGDIPHGWRSQGH